MNENIIGELRNSARKLVRELGILTLNMSKNRAPQHWHTLIEVANEPNITISKLSQLLLLTSSSMSKIVKSLINEKLIIASDGVDKREKQLQITDKGLNEIKHIDDYSLIKIKGALEYLNKTDIVQIVYAMNKYSYALEMSRLSRDKVKIHTLSTSRTLRKQIIRMIENIQKIEYSLPVGDEINNCILKAEQEFYFNHSCNFWYAADDAGEIIGSIGLKKIGSNKSEIKKFFVHEKYRGKGISQKLLITLVKASIKHQIKYLYLGTVDTLHAAHRFYEKNGFEQISVDELPKQFEKCPIDKIFYRVVVDTLLKNLEI